MDGTLDLKLVGRLSSAPTGRLVSVRKSTLSGNVFIYLQNCTVRLTEKTAVQVTIRPVQLFLVGSPKQCSVCYREGQVHPAARCGSVFASIWGAISGLPETTRSRS